jgi:hypothetical protein
MSANSVSPPQEGITRLDSNEYLAVTGRKELSAKPIAEFEQPDSILGGHDAAIRRQIGKVGQSAA